MQILIEILVIRLNDVREAMKQISHCNDDIIFDYGVDAAVVEKLDDMRELLFAEVGAQTHEFAIGQDADDLKLAA